MQLLDINRGPGIVGALGILAQPQNAIQLIFILVALMLSLIAFGRLQGSLRLLVIHLVLSLYIELLGSLTRHSNNLLIFTVYLPFDFGLMLFATRDYLGKVFAPLAAVMMLSFAGSYSYLIYRDGLMTLPLDSMLLYWIFLVIVWLLVLLMNIRQNMSRRLVGVYVIAASTLLYYGCNLPIWGMFRFTARQLPAVGATLQAIGTVVSMARYLLTGIGLLIISRNTALPSAEDSHYKTT